MGSYIMLVINPDAYSRYLLGKGTDPAYMQAMLARFQTWMIPGMAVGTLMRSSREVLNHCPGRPDSSPPVPVPICFSLLNTPMKPCLRFSGYLHRGGRFSMVTAGKSLLTRISMGWLYGLNIYPDTVMSAMMKQAGFKISA